VHVPVGLRKSGKGCDCGAGVGFNPGLPASPGKLEGPGPPNSPSNGAGPVRGLARGAGAGLGRGCGIGTSAGVGNTPVPTSKGVVNPTGALTGTAGAVLGAVTVTEGRSSGTLSRASAGNPSTLGSVIGGKPKGFVSLVATRASSTPGANPASVGCKSKPTPPKAFPINPPRTESNEGFVATVSAAACSNNCSWPGLISVAGGISIGGKGFAVGNSTGPGSGGPTKGSAGGSGNPPGARTSRPSMRSCSRASHSSTLSVIRCPSAPVTVTTGPTAGSGMGPKGTSPGF